MVDSKRSMFLLIWVLSLVLAQSGSVVYAADCNALRDGIRKERVLMKKRTLVNAALLECPDDPAVVYQAGYIFERLRKYKEALVRYRKAIALDAKYAKAHFSIGDIEALQNNYSKAIVAYTEGLRLEPGNERARASLKLIQAQYMRSSPVQIPDKKASASPVAGTVKKNVVREKIKSVKKVSPATPKLAVVAITRLNIPFEKRSIELSQDAKDVLSVVVGQALNQGDMLNEKFEIGGHTDNSGDSGKDREVSRKRALAVQKFLVDNFAIDSNRFKIAAYGHEKPEEANNSGANKAISNRVGFTKID